MKPRTITEDQFRRGQICFVDLQICHCAENKEALEIANKVNQLEINRYQERIKELEEEFALYCRHRNDCEMMCERLKRSDYPCTCGWEALKR